MPQVPRLLLSRTGTSTPTTATTSRLHPTWAQIAGATLTIDAGWPIGDLDAVNGNVLNAVGGTPAGDAIQFSDSANNGLGFTIQADLVRIQ